MRYHRKCSFSEKLLCVYCLHFQTFSFLFQPIKVDSEEDESLHFPSVSEVSDASLLLLKRKSNGKYTLFRVNIKLSDKKIIFNENIAKR